MHSLAALLKSRIRSDLAALMRPLLARLAEINIRLDAIDQRIAAIGRRVDEIELLIQVTGTRVATLTEHSVAVAESEARMARRVEDIERLLGAPAGER